MYERRLLKERQKEDHLYADKEKFVTASYRAKLEADAKWLAEDKARDDAEAAEDVTKRGDLSDFHRNLMTRNASAGADAGIGAGGRKAPEPASETAEQIAAREAKEAAEEKGRRLTSGGGGRRARESREPNARPTLSRGCAGVGVPTDRGWSGDARETEG